MIRLEEKYEQAIQFRKRGFTYSEIAKIVDVSKSTVSNWLSKKAFSKKIKEDNVKRAAKDNVKRIGLINKARRSERISHYAEALRSAKTEYVHYKKDARFIAGLMVYLLSGDTTDTSRIRVSSSEHVAHRIFIQFVQEYLGVEKQSIHFWFMTDTLLHEEKQMKLWSKRINLSVSQFYKTQCTNKNVRKKALQQTAGNTIIGNTVLKKKLMLWLELFVAEQ